MEKRIAVLSLSGGMDSSTLLLHLLDQNYEVIALSFDYGQKHKVELEKAKELVKFIKDAKKVHQTKWKLKHKVIKLQGLQKLLNSSLVKGGKDVPEGHYEQENMKDTIVPNRNKIFSSIIQAVALSKSVETNSNVLIALGIHAGDHLIYADCRQEFRDADFHAFQVGNWGSDKVSIYTPYLEVNKFDILEDGERCCKNMKLDFDEVYKRTNTSYKPYPSGNSDYKSASSVERIEAFIKLGRPDSVQYEDENGLVNWNTVVSHVETILANHEI